MTLAKKLKKAIRSRAARTGERYTSARRHVLEARRRRAVRTAAPARETAVPVEATAARSGRSRVPRTTTGEASVRKHTGHGLDHWFAVLDAFGAAAKGHTAAARHLSEAHGVPGWHCQMITVEYERARGLRAPNQSSRGDFQVSVSRTVAAPVTEIAAAFGEARRRRQWLRGADTRLVRALEEAFTGDTPCSVTLRTTEDARLRYRWDGSTVQIWITGKAGGKAAVVAANTKLAGAGEVEPRRRAWSEALELLKAHLGG